MARYPAFLNGKEGAYGVTFPDLPGIATMGESVDDTLLNAEEALRDCVTETEADGARAAAASPIERVSPPEKGHARHDPPHSPSGRSTSASPRRAAVGTSPSA